MPKWTKWIVVAVLVAVPTLGFAVTKYRAAHRTCPITHQPCPCDGK